MRNRTKPAARWGMYLLAGMLLLVSAAGAATRMSRASATPEPAAAPAVSTTSPPANGEAASNAPAGDDSMQTLNLYGDRLRPLVKETDGAQTLNIHGPGGHIIAQVVRDRLGGQKVRHLLADHLGSTRVALDGDGNTVARFEYGPHGDTTASGTAAVGVRYRYTGHAYDEEQRVYETPARGYDPTTGRFLSVDPQRQDASPYVYAGNNPVGYLDPTGGGEVPFFMFTGFETRQSGARRISVTADAISLVFGRYTKGGGQHAISADVFNSRDELVSLAEVNAQSYTSNSVVDYGKMYLFIGGDKTEDQMARLREGMDALKRSEQGFAREITIINFSGNVETGKKIKEWFLKAGRDPLLVHAGLETDTYRTGQRVTKFTSGRGKYWPSEFVAYVHGLEKAYKQRPFNTLEQRQRDKEYRQAWDEFVNWDPDGRKRSSGGAGPRFITVHSDTPEGRTASELPLPNEPMITNLEPYDGE